MSGDTLEQLLLFMYGAFLDTFSVDILRAGDMYGIGGVKECMLTALRHQYCHLFHQVTAAIRGLETMLFEKILSYSFITPC